MSAVTPAPFTLRREAGCSLGIATRHCRACCALNGSRSDCLSR